MPTAKKYYQLVKRGNAADIDIYGDITSFPWYRSDVSADNLSRLIEGLDDVDVINVHINSYGGEVSEGLAIYNALRRHRARIVTTCDGFACSVASVIMMAGDERVMCDASLMMIHNAWYEASGDAAELRKAADDLDKITQASKAAYLSRINIDEPELSRMMDEETWISPEDALSMGFATAIERHVVERTPSQSAIRSIMKMIARQAENTEDDDREDEGESDETESPDAESGDDGEDQGESEGNDEGEDESPGDSDEDDPGDDEDEKKPSEALQNLGRFFMGLARKE